MPYVERNKDGIIVHIHQMKVDSTCQWLDEDNAEVVAYKTEVGVMTQAKHVLTTTDNEMVRVVEDLIDLLMEKQIFVFTELPSSVQEKLNLRKQLRKDLNVLDSPINDDDIFL